MKLAKMSNGNPEVFIALQGEGRYVGLPVVFVRLSLCNLKCTWCDTPYTWNFKKFDKAKEIIDMTPKELAGVVRDVGRINNNVVFTGGEPLIQEDSIVDVINHLVGWHIEIETNGTIVPRVSLDSLVHFYNVSPKLAGSGNANALKDKSLLFFSQQAKKDRACFKFVITQKETRQDVKEVSDLVLRYNIPKRAVYLMPEGTVSDEMIQWSKEMVSICIETGFSLSTRLQVILYGNQRGT